MNLSSMNACSYFNQLNTKYNATRCANDICFSIWQKSGKQFKLINKGCWTNTDGCESNYARRHLFCCCEGTFCNRETNPEYCFQHVQEHVIWSKLMKMLQNLRDNLLSSIPNVQGDYSLIVIILLVLFIFLLFIWHWKSIWRESKIAMKNSTRTTFFDYYQAKCEIDEKKLIKNNDRVEKSCVKIANGSHADIYLGEFKVRKSKSKANESLAIKVFNKENEVFFRNEIKIYNLLNELKSENVLKIVNASKSTSPNTEFWLVTKYQQHESLFKYLQSKLVTLKQLIQICLDISNGLNCLHGGSQSQRILIAHLDIKPANILLDQNLRASLADFELSKAFYNSKSLITNQDDCLSAETGNQFRTSCFEIGKSYDRGTSRYLSPEILNLSIDTIRTPRNPTHQYIDSLLKSDIYSCSLIFWETSNCLDVFEHNSHFITKTFDKSMIKISKYRMAFEHCLNDNELIDEVVNKRKRPQIQEKLTFDRRANSLLNALFQTIRECWAHDPDSRLSAARLYERLKGIHNSIK